MANVIRKSTNKFTKGLVLDFSPENTKNEVLTHALNATLLTFNGNELSLQNDMGNARVETAFLPEGYIPVGTCEYGGIIYIVSYNPLEDKSLIGCFPSPERNISSEELGLSEKVIDKNIFQDILTGEIKQTSQYVLLREDKLNPGDKFLICSDKNIYKEKLADLYNNESLVEHPVIAFNIVSIEDSGKIIYLNSDIKKYKVGNYKYQILGTMQNGDLSTVDIDEYRNTLSSGYSVFKSKTSGKLAILAELIMIDSYSVTHSVIPRKDELSQIIDGVFDIIIHTDVTPELTVNNYNLAPKLKYYYLKKSLGYLQLVDDKNNQIKKELFYKGNYSQDFLNTLLSDIYIPTTEESIPQTSLGQEGKFNFPKPETYHGRMYTTTGTGENNLIYTKFEKGKYHRVSFTEQIKDKLKYFAAESFKATYYYYNEEGTTYAKHDPLLPIVETYTYYKIETVYSHVNAKRDEQYKNEELYKITTTPSVATEEIIKNTNIEKFAYQNVEWWTVADTEDLEDGTNLWYFSEGKYIEFKGTPLANVTYYLKHSELTIISVGYNPTTIKGILYYYKENQEYVVASEQDKKTYWDFTTYPYKHDDTYGCPITLYRKVGEDVYKEITTEQANQEVNDGTTIYYSSDYVKVPKLELNLFNPNKQLFLVALEDIIVSDEWFEPSTDHNYILGLEKPSGDYPKDDPIYVYSISNFIPELIENEKNLKELIGYTDVKLADIKLPSFVTNNGLDLPFKYDYTIVPCMGYGRLDHLAISNTVDFSKLHAFNQSDFTVWKYRIDNDLLRLTFGSEIYDTYETYKVSGLVLEFYDCWGFAGSVEIINKKSYSGIFTKIISLDTLQEISTKKVVGKEYKEVSYKRNINITETDDEFMFNNESVSYNSDTGWSVSENDCGTLYSNMVYGVKTYFRRETDSGFEFIPKKLFFLYTLPIYNDYYNTTNYFLDLTYPKLELMMTYKLEDNSTKSVYSQEGVIKDGYLENDLATIQKYQSGTFENGGNISTTKYYKYEGTTNLYLEIGLKKDYENIGLSYDPEINNYFSCKLQLTSDNDKNITYTVNSGILGLTSPDAILNYPDNKPLNKLGFSDDYSNKFEINSSDFNNYNFINKNGTNSIKIKYEFVVGYDISINNIRETQVPATTVCALCHKNSEGEYNYEDFGIYKALLDNIEYHLSNAMFYNAGTSQLEVFGVCRQVQLKGNIEELCSSLQFYTLNTKSIENEGKLNTPNPLKDVLSYIGKLTFCQPHVHGLSSESGVGIYIDKDESWYSIPPGPNDVNWPSDSDWGSDDTKGLVPSVESTIPKGYKSFYSNPIYNMCLNTVNSIDSKSEFISTIDYEEGFGRHIIWGGNDDGVATHDGTVDKARRFTGFTGTEIATFNKKLLETMKSVYAYNPDYDSLSVNIGDISLQKYNPSFVSNLLSKEAKLEFVKSDGTLLTYGENDEYKQTLNNFIGIRNKRFSDYLSWLNTYSYITIRTENNDILPQIQFVEDLKYCGSSVYLISPLTYNTPIPTEIEDELEFTASNTVVVKDSEGENQAFIQGAIDKKALYGFHADSKKLILLDVNDYSIDEDGVLTISSPKEFFIKTESIEGITEDFTSNTDLPNITITNSLKESDELSVKLNFGVNPNYKILNFFATDLAELKITAHLTISSNSTNYTYNSEVSSIGYTYKFIVLKNITLELLKLVDNENLDKLINYPNEQQDFNFTITINGTLYTFKASEIYVNTAVVNSNGLINDGEYRALLFNIFGLESSLVGLLKVNFKSIQYTITQNLPLDNYKQSIIHVPRTNSYVYIFNNKYTIIDTYKNAKLRGSSITINDLTYDPKPEGHRLYMRNSSSYNFDPKLGGKLYYRSINARFVDGEWTFNKNKHKNTLFLYTGPCFTKDNL